MIDERMKLPIDEKQWRRGKGSSGSALFNDEGMCCLGFFCRALGLSKNEVTGVVYPRLLVLHARTPQQRERAEERLPKWLLEDIGQDYAEPTPDVTMLACINDDRTIDDSVRKQKITTIFARHGVDVEFINSEAP